MNAQTKVSKEAAAKDSSTDSVKNAMAELKELEARLAKARETVQTNMKTEVEKALQGFTAPEGQNFKFRVHVTPKGVEVHEFAPGKGASAKSVEIAGNTYPSAAQAVRALHTAGNKKVVQWAENNSKIKEDGSLDLLGVNCHKVIESLELA